MYYPHSIIAKMCSTNSVCVCLSSSVTFGAFRNGPNGRTQIIRRIMNVISVCNLKVSVPLFGVCSENNWSSELTFGFRVDGAFWWLRRDLESNILRVCFKIFRVPNSTWWIFKVKRIRDGYAWLWLANSADGVSGGVYSRFPPEENFPLKFRLLIRTQQYFPTKHKWSSINVSDESFRIMVRIYRRTSSRLLDTYEKAIVSEFMDSNNNSFTLLVRGRNCAGVDVRNVSHPFASVSAQSQSQLHCRTNNWKTR